MTAMQSPPPQQQHPPTPPARERTPSLTPVADERASGQRRRGQAMLAGQSGEHLEPCLQLHLAVTLPAFANHDGICDDGLGSDGRREARFGCATLDCGTSRGAATQRWARRWARCWAHRLCGAISRTVTRWITGSRCQSEGQQISAHTSTINTWYPHHPDTHTNPLTAATGPDDGSARRSFRNAPAAAWSPPAICDAIHPPLFVRSVESPPSGSSSMA